MKPTSTLYSKYIKIFPNLFCKIWMQNIIGWTKSDDDDNTYLISTRIRDKLK